MLDNIEEVDNMKEINELLEDALCELNKCDEYDCNELSHGIADTIISDLLKDVIDAAPTDVDMDLLDEVMNKYDSIPRYYEYKEEE